MSAPRRSFVDRIETLPALPDIVHRLLQMSESSQTTADEMAGLLREDPALSARVLRVANSPYYGVARPIAEVSRAVSMLGTVNVCNLVISLSVRDTWPDLARESVACDALWRHSIATAAAAELTARSVRSRSVETAFVAGLLHDVGRLAMLSFEPKLFAEALIEARLSGSPQHAERTRFGCDHAEAGERILRHWGLPEPLWRVTAQHHDRHLPRRGPVAELLAIAVLADRMAHLVGMGLDVPGTRSPWAEAVALLSLSEARQINVLERLRQHVSQTAALIDHAEQRAAGAPRTPGSRAIWICADGGTSNRLGQCVLRHRGWEVEITGLGAGAVPPAELIVIALPEARRQEASALATALRERGHHGLLVLWDPPPGATGRRCDEPSGAVCIPRSFTSRDLDWALKRLAAGAPREAQVEP